MSLSLSSLLNSAKIDGVHREFQKAIGAAECRYVPERGTLLVISRSESTQRRANMIQEMCFRNLSQKVRKSQTSYVTDTTRNGVGLRVLDFKASILWVLTHLKMNLLGKLEFTTNRGPNLGFELSIPRYNHAPKRKKI